MSNLVEVNREAMVESFVDYYVRTGVPAEAWKRAGFDYSSPSHALKSACALLRTKNVQEMIQRRIKRPSKEEANRVYTLLVGLFNKAYDMFIDSETMWKAAAEKGNHKLMLQHSRNTREWFNTLQKSGMILAKAAGLEMLEVEDKAPIFQILNAPVTIVGPDGKRIEEQLVDAKYRETRLSGPLRGAVKEK